MLKVLIAEDNLILADILEDFLISAGFDVCGLASTVDEAVALADLHNPDLAILDFRLGQGESGAHIRARLRNKDTTGILYVSGDPLDAKLTRADGEAYIQKPYGLGDIVKALHIVHEIKTTGKIPASPFPPRFYLLKESIDRKTA